MTKSLVKKLERKGHIEQNLTSQGLRLLGIDEVGRGCLAGPIYAACVAINYEKLALLKLPEKNLVRDSKTLSTAQRNKILPTLSSICLEHAIGIASVTEIEEHGIVTANFLAMHRAFLSMHATYDLLLIDGNQMNPLIPIAQQAIVGGDGLCFAIAAASIFAKEARDDYMRLAAVDYPSYDFASNVGYGTKSHLTALANYGITPLHRRNFAPIQRYQQAGHFADPLSTIGSNG